MLFRSQKNESRGRCAQQGDRALADSWPDAPRPGLAVSRDRIDEDPLLRDIHDQTLIMVQTRIEIAENLSSPPKRQSHLQMLWRDQALQISKSFRERRWREASVIEGLRTFGRHSSRPLTSLPTLTR